MANTASEEPPHPLTPEQVRVGTNKIRTHAERQAFWKNSDIGKQLGFDGDSNLKAKQILWLTCRKTNGLAIKARMF